MARRRRLDVSCGSGAYPGQYVALEFATDADQAQIGQMFREADAAYMSSWAYWSIGRCPGDFPSTMDPCHGAGGAVASIGREIGAPRELRRK